MRRRRPSNPYNEFVSGEMKRLKATYPQLDHQTAFKMAASSEWCTAGHCRAGVKSESVVQRVTCVYYCLHGYTQPLTVSMDMLPTTTPSPSLSTSCHAIYSVHHG